MFLWKLITRVMSDCPGGVQRIVLQPKGAKGLDDVVQPIRESGYEAYFDRLPDGEFDVVVVTTNSTQKYGVSLRDRAKLVYQSYDDSAVATVSAKPAQSEATSPSRETKGTITLFVQGDGPHIADAIRTLQAELNAQGVVSIFVSRGESYDYTIVFGEGNQQSASAIALDANSNAVAVAVRGAFTGKGAAEGAMRDLAKKLAAIAR